MSSMNRVRKLQILYFSRKKKSKKWRKMFGPEPPFIHTTCVPNSGNLDRGLNSLQRLS